MEIKNQFRIPLDVPEAWNVLIDIPRIAHFAPGASLVECKPDGSYLGIVRVKLGPIALSFRGTLTYQEVDEASRTVIAEAVGAEERGRGTARAKVTFVLSADDDGGTRVDVVTNVLLVGPIAQYGRGTAVIQSTAQVIMDEFARNFAAEFGARISQKINDVVQPDGAADRTSDNPNAQEPGAGAQIGLPESRAAAPAISALAVLRTALLAMVKGWFNRKHVWGTRQ